MLQEWKNIIRVCLLAILISSALEGAGWGSTPGYDDFRIQDFIWLDEREAALYLDGNASTSRNENNDLETSYYQLNDNTNRNFSSSATFNPRFYLKETKADHALAFSAPVTFGLNQSSYEQYNQYIYADYQPNYSNESQNNSNSISLNPSMSYDKYWEQLFVGASTDLQGSRSNYSSESVTDNYYSPSSNYYSESTQTEWVQDLYANGTVRLGWGRLYEGNFSYQAMQLIEDLSLAGNLVLDVTPEDMKQLSQIIAEERSKYYFDSRKQTLDALERITDFLQKKGYVKPGNYRALFMLADDYQNVSRTSRSFGQRLALVLFGNIRHGSRHNESESKTLTGISKSSYNQPSDDYVHLLGMEYIENYPLSQKWQLNWQGTLDYGKSCSKIIRDFDTYQWQNDANRLYFWRPSLSAALYYYYDTRWTFFLSDTLSGELNRTEERDAYIPDDDSITPTRLELNYDKLTVTNSIYFTTGYSMNYNLHLNLSLGLDLVYQGASNFTLAGNAFDSSADPTWAELKDKLDQRSKKQFVDYSALFSVSYRLF